MSAHRIIPLMRRPDGSIVYTTTHMLAKYGATALLRVAKRPTELPAGAENPGAETVAKAFIAAEGSQK